MAEARRKVRLEEVGISHVRPKIAVTGTIILEVPGENSAAKADQLAEKLQAALADKEVRITKSVKLAEVRITGLDGSVTKEELASVLANAGGCLPVDIRVGDIRRGPTGLGVAWARCPATAAKKMVGGGRITVGWVAARVETLAPRSLQCFGCLATSYTRTMHRPCRQGRQVL